MLDHLAGVIGKLGEGGSSGEQLLGQVFAVLDAVDGLVEDDSGSGEILLLDSSDFLEEFDMLAELDELVLGDSKLSGGLSLLDVAVIELLGGDGKGF